MDINVSKLASYLYTTRSIDYAIFGSNY